MESNFTGAQPLYTAEFNEILAEPEHFSGNSFGVANSFEDLFQYNFDLNPFDFEIPDLPSSPSLPPLPPSLLSPPLSPSSSLLSSISPLLLSPPMYSLLLSQSLPPPPITTVDPDSMFSENSNACVYRPGPAELAVGLNSMSLEESNPWTSNSSPIGPTMSLEKLNVQSSRNSPTGPTMPSEKLNAWASMPSQVGPNLASAESNVQMSRPGPVGPTVGQDRGKSVVSSGGGEKKAKRRYERHASSMTMFEGKPVSLVKRAMDNEQLAELARVDPKKAKRILSNRKSAAISKEKRTRYITELEELVESLQARVTTVRNNITRLQRKNAKWPAQLKEFRRSIEARREDLRIRKVISEARERALQSLKIETDRYAVILRDHSAADLLPQFSSQLPLQQFHNPPTFQHLDPPQQPLFHIPSPLPPPSQNFNEQYDINFSNYVNPPN